MPKLYLMRHGYADNASPDIKRKLTSDGCELIKSIAGLLAEKNTRINQVYYSAAKRAKETALLMCDGLAIPLTNQHEDIRIYNASVNQLQTVISEIGQQAESVLLVGHNPGFANLVLSLSEQHVRLFPGNIAVLQADSWQGVYDSECKLVETFN